MSTNNQDWSYRFWSNPHTLWSPVNGVSIEAVESLDGFRVSLGQRQGVRWSFDWRHLHTAANIHQDLETWDSLSPPSLCRDWSYCHADLSRKHGQLSWRGSDNTTDVLTMRARETRRWAAMTSELHTGDVNKSSSATRLSQRSGSGSLHKTMNSVGESDRQGRENQGSCYCAIIGLCCLSQVLIGLART